MGLWLYVREHTKAQLAVVLVENVSEDRATAKVSSNRFVEPGIELGAPVYKAIDLSTTLRRMPGSVVQLVACQLQIQGL